ncbi:LexA family transcriptional regulator [Lelliottia sp. V106_10]|uniref:LexA family protein n=1 Tax=Lelliottia wanjuensis TaxID=3050585 RepID=UPI00254DF078|nr:MULTISPECIES: LexA family transcriptional regulator [unclassified Lelliottia]MDK9373404.1 LexA family transcriptional regulator [Lelliottia sp. V106_10]MDK9600197.1 LexA family transcriptional regulator [Lelliottia sp. V106_5]
MKTLWYELAKARMKAMGIRQDALAERLNISQGAINHWLNGKRSPSLQEIGAIFELLGVSNAQLNSDGTFNVEDEVISEPVIPQYKYPLFSSVQAGGFGEVGTYTRDDAVKWIPSVKKASKDAFWLTVTGNSMTAPTGSTPSFPEGVLLLVDPAEDIKSGDFVVAAINGGTDVTFKKLERDAGTNYLVPLNPSYNTLSCDETCRIIGKVVKAQWADDTFK